MAKVYIELVTVHPETGNSSTSQQIIEGLSEKRATELANSFQTAEKAAGGFMVYRTVRIL